MAYESRKAIESKNGAGTPSPRVCLDNQVDSAIRFDDVVVCFIQLKVIRLFRMVVTYFPLEHSDVPTYEPQ